MSEATDDHMLRKQFRRRARWVWVGRWLTYLAIGLGAFTILGGPALGYYIDTRVFPGETNQVVTYDAESGKRNVKVDDQDTMPWAWFAIPYGIEGAILLVFGSIFVGDRINQARKDLNMNTIYDRLPTDHDEPRRVLEAERKERDALYRGYR